MTVMTRLASFLALVLLASLAGCTQDKPYYLTDPMAPPGSTPEQIRAFCTRLSDEAADWNEVSDDPVGSRQRAAYATFGACMARHNIRP
jgi:predicted small lipoprotein YifL